MQQIRALLLAAGIGSRLKPITDTWPKCLVPIRRRPILEYWLENVRLMNINKVLVNLHYLPEPVYDFLNQPRFKKWVTPQYEPKLLGTAGPLKANKLFFENSIALVAHVDNLCFCDFDDFIDFHRNRRPLSTIMTMMTFDSPYPKGCGIVELDSQGVVQAFHEKVANPPGIRSSAAVFLLEPEVLDWISKQKEDVLDFTEHVIPHFMGQISTWHNDEVLCDTGTLELLKTAQSQPIPDLPPLESNNLWQQKFEKQVQTIHQMIKNA